MTTPGGLRAGGGGSERPESQSIRVLYVAADPDSADAVSASLERADDALAVVTATTAADGLDRIERGDVDCVVSAYDTPGMNGVEFLERVREDAPTLPFILFTGTGSESVAGDAISAGVTDYLQKRGTADQYATLANRIRTSVDHARDERQMARCFEAMNAAREGVALLDEAGTFTFVNPAYADLYGYERDELRGRHLSFLWPDDAGGESPTEILDSVPDDGRWEGEVTQVTSDGDPILVDLALTHASDGTLVALADDVTQERATEQELESTQRRLDHFVNAVTDYAIFTLDTDGRVTSWNRGAERIKGYEADEILGEHFSVFYPEERRSAGYPSHLLDVALERGSVEDLGWRVRADGSRFWGHVTITAVRDDDGTHLGFIKVVKDETDRHERRVDDGDGHASAVSKDLLSRALDEAPVGITVTGAAWEDTPLVYVNEGFVRLTGYSREEAIGRNCRFLQGEATDDAAIRALSQAVRDAETTTVELRNYRADGTEFWNRVTVAPLRDERGEVANYVGIQEDVTEKKRRERQLERQLDQFEAFGSVLSHDVRTPLQVATSRVELAAETGDEAHLEKASAALDRLDDLLDDLSTVMREGELVTDQTTVSVTETARDVWSSIETDSAALELDGDVDARASRDALARLLGNLLTNALDHAGDGVTVTVGPLSNGFYVEDTGVGIPPDERDSVLEFGYSTKDGDVRSGLGLASVEQIAVAHGWDVTVTESAAGGARFEFTAVERPERR